MIGRGRGIRTPGPLLPKQVLYQVGQKGGRPRASQGCDWDRTGLNGDGVILRVWLSVFDGPGKSSKSLTPLRRLGCGKRHAYTR